MRSYFARKKTQEMIFEMVRVYQMNPIQKTINYLSDVYEVAPRTIRKYLAFGGVKFRPLYDRVRDQSGKFVSNG